MIYKFKLENVLDHDNYSWRKTLIAYDIELDKEINENNLILTDEKNKNVEFQLFYDENNKRKISFLTDLKKNEKKVFTLSKGETKRKDSFNFEYVSFDNDLINILFDGRVYEMNIPCINKKCNLINSGVLFKEYLIECNIDEACSYELKLKFIKDMPFFEMEEKISATPQQEIYMSISIKDFAPKYRYSIHRGIEKADKYSDENSTLPVIINPYENWNALFSSKYIAFSDTKKCSGIFIRDNEKWYSGKYNIWESDNSFGVKCCVCDGLTFLFPIKQGTRFCGICSYAGDDCKYVEELWRQYAFINLDKVKSWVLDWEEDKNLYPLFWKDNCFKTQKTTYFERKVCECNFEYILEKSKNISDITKMGPVGQREFTDWTLIFDVNANEMTNDDFKRFKAFFAFFAYLSMSEDYMPTRNMLAGHPNFLIDNAAVAGYAAALFKNHPDAIKWREYFNNCVRLNFKYHIRPDVIEWNAKGGRATESTGVYNIASLCPMIHVYTLFEKCGYKNSLNSAWAKKWLDWMTNTLSAPVDGRRVFMPHGAHAGVETGFVEVPYEFLILAKLMEKYFPDSSKNAMRVFCGNSSLNADNCENIWRYLIEVQQINEIPKLKSEKYTGYGYVLRKYIGSENEISVHIQQLDKGPNYRWGTFENTGNGSIHYFACGKRWSFNEAESTGDKNLGAAEGDCGFAVLDKHTYKNIGFSELKNPIIDFDFVQSVKLDADEEVSHLYRYRNVIMSGGEYIAIYDSLADMTARGRFSWFVNNDEKFPNIIPIKPDGQVSEYKLSGAVDFLEKGQSKIYAETKQNSRLMSVGKGIDGNGDFLTIVSHSNIVVYKKDDYVIIELQNRKDTLFDDSCKNCFKNDVYSFCGYRGLYSLYKNGEQRLALLEGDYICLNGFKLSTIFHNAASIEYKNGRYYGKLCLVNDDEITFEYEQKKEVFDLKKGNYLWCLSTGSVRVVKQMEEYEYLENTDFERNVQSHEFGFNGFDFRRPELNRKYPFQGKE